MSNRTALYCRCSTDSQSTDAQISTLKKYAESRGFNITGIFSDVGLSGARESRPELNKLMDLCRKREIDRVLVYRFDRFARSTRHLSTALDEFKSLGIDFISFSENIDTSSPIGQAVFTILSAVSQLERDLIRERSTNGIKRAREIGVKFGPPVTLNHMEMKRLRSKGLSFHQIAKSLKCSTASVSRVINKGSNNSRPAKT